MLALTSIPRYPYLRDSITRRLLSSNPNVASLRTKSTLGPFEGNVSGTNVDAATRNTMKTPAVETSVPIMASLAAAAAGICTVSVAAAITEQVTAPMVPDYDPPGQRFDQNTYMGRFFRMLLQCDPRLLFYSQKQIWQAKERLDKYKEHGEVVGSTSVTNHRELWEARRLVDSAVNDKGDIVPSPFRMSGYVGFNGPICVAMVASQSTPALLFWSWVNQSQNALINYYNRNTSSPMTNETLVKSYLAAVGSALTVAFGLATMLQRRFSPAKAQQLLRWVAFPSAVVASSLNCYIVRSPEIKTGIPLQDSTGEMIQVPISESMSSASDTDVSSYINYSQMAAAQGVYSTTASRAILQAPVYFFAPVLLAAVPFFRRVLLKQPSMTLPLTTYLVLVSFGIGLPATIAIFPQISTIAASQVEERFQNLRDPTTQQPYKVFYYNKGL